MSKFDVAESPAAVGTAGDLPISGPALIGLFQAVLERGKPFRFRAGGASMSPSIRDGDVITVHPPAGTPRLGDVVAHVFAETGKLAVHRIVGRTDGRWLIAGDGVYGEHDQAREAEILGFVTRIERNGKDVRFGLGPERRLIAVVTRHRLTRETARLLWRLLRPFHAWLQGPA